MTMIMMREDFPWPVFAWSLFQLFRLQRYTRPKVNRCTKKINGYDRWCLVIICPLAYNRNKYFSQPRSMGPFIPTIGSSATNAARKSMAKFFHLMESSPRELWLGCLYFLALLIGDNTGMSLYKLPTRYDQYKSYTLKVQSASNVYINCIIKFLCPRIQERCPQHT